jgi:hypothetical protein
MIAIHAKVLFFFNYRSNPIEVIRINEIKPKKFLQTFDKFCDFVHHFQAFEESSYFENRF